MKILCHWPLFDGLRVMREFGWKLNFAILLLRQAILFFNVSINSYTREE